MSSNRDIPLFSGSIRTRKGALRFRCDVTNSPTSNGRRSSLCCRLKSGLNERPSEPPIEGSQTLCLSSGPREFGGEICRSDLVPGRQFMPASHAQMSAVFLRTDEGAGGRCTVLGRSGGGFTTRIHALVDGLGNPIQIHITAGTCAWSSKRQR